MLPRNHPDRIQIAFDDHHLVANAGLILPSTLALHLGRPNWLIHLDLGRAPGGANTGDKIMTLVALWPVATALTMPTCCVLAGPRGCWAVRRPVHPGDLPAQLPVGPRPPTGSGEPGAAGTSLGRSLNNHGSLTIDLDHHLCLRTVQGGSAPPRLHRAGLSPAAGRRRRHRRRADGSAA